MRENQGRASLPGVLAAEPRFGADRLEQLHQVRYLKHDSVPPSWLLLGSVWHRPRAAAGLVAGDGRDQHQSKVAAREHRERGVGVHPLLAAELAAVEVDRDSQRDPGSTHRARAACRPAVRAARRGGSAAAAGHPGRASRTSARNGAPPRSRAGRGRTRLPPRRRRRSSGRSRTVRPAPRRPQSVATAPRRTPDAARSGRSGAAAREGGSGRFSAATAAMNVSAVRSSASATAREQVAVHLREGCAVGRFVDT